MRYGYTAAGPVRRAIRLAVTSRPLAWLSARLLPAVDRGIYRLTGGRLTFSAWASGLPVIILVTRGARTGRRREVRVLGIPDGERIVIIAANFGKATNPAWYHNLKARPDVEVIVGETTARYVACELADVERDRMFEHAVAMNPGWLRYRHRAGDRGIAVFRLEPQQTT